MPLAYTLAEKARGINFPNETEAAYKRIWDQFCVFYVSPSFIFFAKDICSLLCCFFSFVFGSTGRLKKKGTVGYVSCDKYVYSLIPSKHKQLLATAREVSRHLKRRKTIIP